MPRFIQFLLEMACIAVLAFIMANLFIAGLDKQYEIDAAKTEARMHQMIEKGF